MGLLFGFVCALVGLLLCLCGCSSGCLFVCLLVSWFVRLFVCSFVCSFVCVRLCVCFFGWLVVRKRLPKTHIVRENVEGFQCRKGSWKRRKIAFPLLSVEFLLVRLQSRPLRFRLRKKNPSEESQRLFRRS